MRVSRTGVALAASCLLLGAACVLTCRLRPPSDTEIHLRIIPRAAEAGDLDTLQYYAKRGYPEAIRRLGDPRFRVAEPFLVGFLSDDRHKVNAATALAKIDLGRNLPRLIGLLADKDPDIRYQTLTALASIPRWKEEHAWQAVRAVAAHLQDEGPVGGPCLPNWPLGLTAHEVLCDLLAMPDEPAGSGDEAWSKARMASNATFWATWMKEHGRESILALVLKHSQHSSARARARAAAQLSKYGEPRSVDRLIALLGDSDSEVREQAGAALRRLTQGSEPMKDPKTFSRVWHSDSQQAWEAWWRRERDRFRFR